MNRAIRFLLPFLYTEIEEIRKDKNGNDLPNARRITRMLVTTDKKTSDKYSAYLTAFGQFIDHDLTQTPVFKGDNGEFLDCCKLFPLPKVSSSRYPSKCSCLIQKTWSSLIKTRANNVECIRPRKCQIQKL